MNSTEHYLVLSGIHAGTDAGDIYEALLNQTRLSSEDIGRIDADGSNGVVEIYTDQNEYDPSSISSIRGVNGVRVTQWDPEDWKYLARYISRYKELVELERQEEMERHEKEIRHTSGKERQELGRAVLGLTGTDAGEGLGYKVMVKFSKRRRGTKLPETEIAVGDLVRISKTDPLRDDNPAGTVAEQTNYSITVAFDGPLPGFLLNDVVRLDLYVNDITYQRMLTALERLPFHRRRDLVRKLVGITPFGEVPSPQPSDQDDLNHRLNSSQGVAARRALDSEFVFCIHGPPGTGKTTTLAKVVRQLVADGAEILATAGSNAAVDNMVQFLMTAGGEIDLVRLGHPARVTPGLREVTLDYQVGELPDFKRSRELIERAAELKEEQDSYQYPSGRYRRGMSNSQIHQLAKKGSGSRGVSREKIREMSQWLKLQEEIDQLYKKSEKLRDKAIQEVLQEADVVCSTNSTSGSNLLEGFNFDVAVIDEATQALEPSCLIPINRADRLVLAGDHKQLPPTILSREAEDGLVRTLFEKIVNRGGDRISETLRTQYRMHEDIMRFPNQSFYDGLLEADETVREHTLIDIAKGDISAEEGWVEDAIDPSEPVVFIDTAPTPSAERQRRGSYSRENPAEARITGVILNELTSTIEGEDVGVISPYSDQIDLLRSRHSGDGLEIKSVDGFQGREKEVILISFVRSNEGDRVGFLKDERRLNVAMTRARRKLIMIGDSGTLGETEIYSRMLDYVRENCLYLEATPGV
ncbi:IGHMBP2 family helicase [Candidatus Bipolaricaulota bacterium]|nr:IGHMBP2 family helicase [Candidatus Bipolaricaulota bacterium]